MHAFSCPFFLSDEFSLIFAFKGVLSTLELCNKNFKKKSGVLIRLSTQFLCRVQDVEYIMWNNLHLLFLSKLWVCDSLRLI